MPATPPPVTAYPASDPGFAALPVDELLAGDADLIARIKLCYGADRDGFERDILALVRRYATCVHLLPATADNYFSKPGGLLRLGLETAFFSLQGTDAHIFSGRATPQSGIRAVFFCFRIPHPDPDLIEAADGAARWSEPAGETVWLCTDPDGKTIADTPRTIADLIRSLPDTPIHHALDRAGLSKLREKVEKELIKTHLRPLQAPVGVSPVLKCWMEVA